MRITDMITQDEFTRYFINFSPLLHSYFITISTTLLLYNNFSFCTNFFTAYPLAFFYHAFFYRRNPVLQVTIIMNE